MTTSTLTIGYNVARRVIFVAALLFLMDAFLPVAGQPINDTGSVNEYCELDTFTARCPDPDQVVVVQSAHFGRMRLGRCLTVNNGNLGCQLDVLSQLEALCSGRRRCDVPVSAVNHGALACTREVRGYLEASYVCVKVISKRKDECQRSSPVEIPATSTAVSPSGHTPAVRGYLASVVTEETGCGSTDSPWLIRAQPGQTVRLHLLDFGTSDHSSKDFNMPYVCQVYAVIREKMSSKPGETICAGENRETLVYTSLTNEVEIRVVAARKDSKSEHFMLKYEVTGCVDMVASNDGSGYHWMRRIGETAMFGCNGSSTTWQLKCDGRGWTGTQLSCSLLSPAEHMTISSSSIWNAFSRSQWAAIIVIMVIAVTLGMIIFFVGLVYLKKRRSGTYARAAGGVGCTGGQICSESVDYHLTLASEGHHRTATLCSPSKLASSASTGTITAGVDQTENDYFRTWQLQRPTTTMTSSSGGPRRTAPMPPVSHPGHGGGTPVRPHPGSLRFGDGVSSGRGCTVPEHVYESPKLERREFVTPPSSTVLNECSCCCDRNTSCNENVTAAALCGELCNCGQPHLQYYELDHTGRSVVRI